MGAATVKGVIGQEFAIRLPASGALRGADANSVAPPVAIHAGSGKLQAWRSRVRSRTRDLSNYQDHYYTTHGRGHRQPHVIVCYRHVYD